MAKKVYAVKRGRTTGLFMSWAECRAQIDGFAGAVYKGFMTLGEAQAWLWGAASDTADAQTAWPNEGVRAKKKMPLAGSPAPADYTVYTDGSCLRNPDGPGGFAAVIISRDGAVREIAGGEPRTTNNRMELRAGIEALKSLPEGSVLDFYTDSQYLRNAFVKRWLSAWKRRGWLTAAGEPVKNQDLWQAMEAACARHTIRFHWVKGHAGNRFNERCDLLARQQALAQKINV